MTAGFKSAWAMVLLVAVAAIAHPHVFVDASVKVLFDENGFSAVKNQWVYDELYSAAMMSSGDRNADGIIDEQENEWFEAAIMGPIKSHNFFNYVQKGSDFLKALSLKNFKASYKNRRLVLNFEVTFSVPVSIDYTMLVIVVSDPTNYIQITTDMENADVDGPESFVIEYFNDSLDGLTLFSAFLSKIEGLYLRYKKK